VSGHFSRIEVIGSTDAYKDDYDWDSMMRAAVLLSHADPDVICWNGSKGGSIGLDATRTTVRLW
jgi:maleate isomerase